MGERRYCNGTANVMHFIVTILIVALSLAALILIIVGAKGKDLIALRIWAIICLTAMLIGPVGTALLPKTESDYIAYCTGYMQ